MSDTPARMRKAPVERHPFAAWFASLYAIGAATCSGKDIVLDGPGALRFGLGVDPDGTPVLGVGKADRDSLLSVKWTGAAFVLNHKGRDWVALSSRDIRVENAVADEPVPLRLWVPMPSGVLDAWGKAAPKRLRLRLIKLKGGAPVCPDAPPLAQLPLTTKAVA